MELININILYFRHFRYIIWFAFGLNIQCFLYEIIEMVV